MVVLFYYEFWWNCINGWCIKMVVSNLGIYLVGFRILFGNMRFRDLGSRGYFGSRVVWLGECYWIWFVYGNVRRGNLGN